MGFEEASRDPDKSMPSFLQEDSRDFSEQDIIHEKEGEDFALPQSLVSPKLDKDEVLAMREEMRRNAGTEVLPTPGLSMEEEKKSYKEEERKSETESDTESSSEATGSYPTDSESSDGEDFKEEYPLLYALKHEEDMDIILNYLGEYRNSLKTMLMKPMQKFLRDFEGEEEEKIEAHNPYYSNLAKYSPADQAYGLLLSVRRKQEAVFSELWETEIFDERHFFAVFDQVVSARWPLGVSILFGSKRTKEMYLSFYPSERMHFYEALITKTKRILCGPSAEGVVLIGDEFKKQSEEDVEEECEEVMSGWENSGEEP